MAAVTYTISETFNKANGELGPNLLWPREVLFGSFAMQVVSNQLEFNVNTPGFHEDFRIPDPNIPYDDVTMTCSVAAMTRTGSDPLYLIGWGFAARVRLHSDEQSYDAYTCELWKTTLLGGELFVLVINKLKNYGLGPGAVVTVLGTDAETIANVTLPGTLTFTLTGPNLSASFTHGGAGPTLTVNAVDSSYSDGPVAIGCGNEVHGTDSALFRIDNFSAVGTRMAATADLMQAKLDSEYSITHPNETNQGALLQRYRDEQNLERWEDYLAHIFAVSTVDTAADAENQFWDAFTPTP